MITRISIVRLLHEGDSNFCPCDDCAVARDVVWSLTGLVLTDEPGDFVLDEVPIAVSA
jgi:hypothetical protein